MPGEEEPLQLNEGWILESIVYCIDMKWLVLDRHKPPEGEDTIVGLCIGVQDDKAFPRCQLVVPFVNAVRSPEKDRIPSSLVLPESMHLLLWIGLLIA
ncbi:MAG: hypothetical protein D6731_07030 [Planctomycetota bacterium]|nr:MAG: hypothetical protein D6731_07030 [Planctomycetota bacterium]